MEATSKSNHALVLIGVGVVLTVIAYSLVAPESATPGYHLAASIIKLVSYSIILFAIAAAVAAVMGKFRTHTLLIFGWLFLVAACLDLGTAAYRKMMIEPQVRRALEGRERK